jgi:hypothetical protein
MPRDAAPALIHATISVVVVVNKLGLRLHFTWRQSFSRLTAASPKQGAFIGATDTTPQAARLHGSDFWSRIYHASPTAAHPSLLLMSSTSWVMYTP